MIHLHHPHLLATNLDATLEFWTTYFRADVMADFTFAGARNVFLRVGDGRLHFYKQSPKHLGQGTVHHLGVETDELDELTAALRSAGFSVKEIKTYPDARYAMVMGPDQLLIELFQPNSEFIGERLSNGYFHTL